DRAARAALFGAAGAAIVGALVLGRCLGALGLGTLAVGRGRAWLPAGVNRSDLVGWSIAAGAGGTLTIFAAVTVLPPPARDTAVLAALAAALVATLAGAAALSWSLRVPREEESEQARSRAAEV
ncbi:MAG: Na+/H+ antiporter NhaA, partial [Elusimicrobia bacterium]|nr:Na+/H+ antiporter NhaA [Elusimicrobiota bacterium]